MKLLKYHKSKLVFALGLLAFIPGLAASQSNDPVLNCTQGETTLFTSNATDIAAFDAAAYGAVLVQIMSLPDVDLNIYVFSPGNIVCTIDADADTSQVNL